MDDQDYRTPFRFTGKLDKLTLTERRHIGKVVVTGGAPVLV